jgi:hypothetical protein
VILNFSMLGVERRPRTVSQFHRLLWSLEIAFYTCKDENKVDHLPQLDIQIMITNFTLLHRDGTNSRYFLQQANGFVFIFSQSYFESDDEVLSIFHTI